MTVYQKHRSLLNRKMMYRGWCLASVRTLRKRVILREKLSTEARMNAGRNYNGPKVAKFLDGWVPSCTNGITIGGLSQRRTRWNCKTSKDARYPRLDEKTPWSFTTAWYWIRGIPVQNRWEPSGASEIPPLYSFNPNPAPILAAKIFSNQYRCGDSIWWVVWLGRWPPKK